MWGRTREKTKQKAIFGLQAIYNHPKATPITTQRLHFCMDIGVTQTYSCGPSLAARQFSVWALPHLSSHPSAIRWAPIAKSQARGWTIGVRPTCAEPSVYSPEMDGLGVGGLVKGFFYKKNWKAGDGVLRQTPPQQLDATLEEVRGE